MENSNWEQRTADLWSQFDSVDEVEFMARHEVLVAELEPNHPRALFERACAQDSTGRSDLAVPLYREALAAGLSGLERRRAVIQLSSSLRNVGNASESVRLLTQEKEMGSDELDDAVAAFLALALTDTGEERKAVSVALLALCPHLPRYHRSLTHYARELETSR